MQRVSLIRTHVGNLFEAGMADSLDILEAEISLRGAERLLGGEREANAGTHRRRSPVSSRRPATETIVPTEFIPDPELLREDRPRTADIAGRPELSIGDPIRIESARYQQSIVKAEFLPVVNGMGGYALVKPNIGERESDWQDIWWLGLTLSWDLNLGGQEFSAVRARHWSRFARSR